MTFAVHSRLLVLNVLQRQGRASMGLTEVCLPNLLLFYKVLIVSRYYQQRHQIFSKYDKGIWMTEDAWFGVTPEPVAKYASRLKQSKN